jgi:hypothetical protein
MASNAALLTRRQVAALLGTTEEEVKTRDNVAFHPTKGSDGSWRYEPSEVSAVLRGVVGDDTGGSPNGAVCGAAFELFKEGKALADMVINLKQPPAVVRGLRSEFDAMVASLTIDQSSLEALAKVLPVRARNGAHLAEMVVALEQRAEQQYQRGYDDGLADATDCGEIVDLKTGQRRTLRPETVDASARAARPVEAAPSAGSPMQR